MNTTELSPKGFRELTPSSQKIFNRMVEQISKLYQGFGYENIHTNAIEYLDVINGSDDTSKEIFSVGRAQSEFKKDDRVRALRFDLTKPFARYVIQNYNELAFPFKRFQIQQSWRGERPQKGRYREFFQADVDVVANENLPFFYDSEVLEISVKALEKLNLPKFTVRINNRKLVQGIFESYGINAASLPMYLRAVDKIEKIGKENVINDFLEIGELTKEKIEDLFEKVLDKKIALDQVDSFLEGLNLDNDLAIQGARELKQMANSLMQIELENGQIILDTSIIRGLDYYTGFVFETNLEGYESFGSILSGGRYENLIADLSNKKLPGVGASIGLSRLFAIMEEIGLEKYSISENSFLIANMEYNDINSLREIAYKIRDKNICEIYPDAVKLVKQIKFAEKKDYTKLVIIEENNTITLKNLESRDQENFANIDEFINSLN